MDKPKQRQVKASNPLEESVGADETFYGLPILVAIELASGFIFSEAECENRTYQTWWAQVSEWFNPQQWECRALVSDGAKALVKLAFNGLGCPSLPDVFHLLYALPQINGHRDCPSTAATAFNSTKAYKRNSKRSHPLLQSLR